MYRAAIIGTGRIGSKLEKDPLRPAGSSHAGSYHLSAQTGLAAGADTDPAALKEFGTDWNLPPDALYCDYREMLRNENLDIASVCAYATERFEMTQAALDSGVKGLWLEKALGCSLREAEAIRDALREHKAVGVVDYPRRGRAPYRRVKQLIDSGECGRLQSVTCHMTHQLIHTGTHAFDVLRYWCGEALSVSGQLESPTKAGDLKDQGGSGQIEMSSGTQVFVSAYRKKYYIFQFDLIFDDARILLGNDIASVFRPGTSKLYSGFKELFPLDAFDWGTDHPRTMLEDLVHSMNTGEAPLFSVDNAIESLRIALSFFASSNLGGISISPDSIDPDLRIENV